VLAVYASAGQPMLRGLRWSPVRFLGRISYSFYLIHFLVSLVLRIHPPQ
jgi:peptidoglycan/LPS O-acetylase OafA/YrhL